MPQLDPQEWADYKEALDIYRAQVLDLIAHIEAENPQVPRPPKPPNFTGWLGEE